MTTTDMPPTAAAAPPERPRHPAIADHSPAPWAILEDDYGPIVVDRNGRHLTQLLYLGEDRPDGVRADARLMASAPAMLDGLEAAWLRLFRLATDLHARRQSDLGDQLADIAGDLYRAGCVEVRRVPREAAAAGGGR